MQKPANPNSWRNSCEAEPDFYALFRQHWDAGTGLAHHARHAVERDRCWIYKTFADAFAKTPGNAGNALDSKTVEAWKVGPPRVHRLQERNKDAILATFFPRPRDARAEAGCAEMEAAWARLPSSTTKVIPSSSIETREDRLAWRLDPPQCIMKNLVELRLHQPDPGNRGSWYVKATLRIDSQVCCQLSPTEAVLISLREPTLTLEAPGFPIAENSRIGERPGGHPHFRPRPNGWHVLRTLDAKGEVNLAKDEHLAVIGGDGSGEGPVTVALIADGRSIRLTPADTEGEPLDAPVPTEEKEAIISLIFCKQPSEDTSGTVVIAQHSMCLKPVE